MRRPPRSIPKIKHRAAQRRHQPTPAEAQLWAHLRDCRLEGIKFRRQHAIGQYITDFCSLKRKLIIELDLEQEEHDKERTFYLESLGYRVIRFWNDQVMNDIEGVIKTIIFALEAENPTPTLVLRTASHPPFELHE